MNLLETNPLKYWLPLALYSLIVLLHLALYSIQTHIYFNLLEVMSRYHPCRQLGSPTLICLCSYALFMLEP